MQASPDYSPPRRACEETLQLPSLALWVDEFRKPLHKSIEFLYRHDIPLKDRNFLEDEHYGKLLAPLRGGVIGDREFLRLEVIGAKNDTCFSLVAVKMFFAAPLYHRVATFIVARLSILRPLPHSETQFQSLRGILDHTKSIQSFRQKIQFFRNSVTHSVVFIQTED